jgi:putative restriction endonuclease
MKSAIEVLDAFDSIRRAQRAGVYAPHKPLLILLALARVQHEEPRLVEFSAIDGRLKQLLAEFGPSSAAKSRHYPFWHLATDGNGALWELSGPREVLKRPAGATPSLTELHAHHIMGTAPCSRTVAGRRFPRAGCLLPVDAACRHRGQPGTGPRRAARSARGNAAHGR